MKNNIKFLWDKDAGISTCTITYKNQEFTGKATCNPQDMDMLSEVTGNSIAEMRALIKVLVFKRDCEIKPAMAATRQLLYAMNRSRNYNRNSYESKMIYRQYQNYQNDLIEIRQQLIQLRKDLKTYIDEKEKFYQSIRKRRSDKTD